MTTKNCKRRKRGAAPLGIPTRPGPMALIVAGQMGGAGKTTTAGLVGVVTDRAGSATAAITRNTGQRLARGWRFAR